ncbi:MAG: ABC transporter substrate-binding protein [Clostridia bacterium]
MAVNNENFRQSIMSALDRVNAVSVIDPQYPENIITNTVTPPNFATGAGLDYTQYDEIVHITNEDSFDADAALEYKDLAISELEDAGCSFPIIIYMRYNPDTSNWDKECQLVEQQLEALLGTDYIDVVVEAGPATGFLSAVRRAGDYALMKCNWGADYADPQTWTDPFTATQTYNFMNQDETRILMDEPCDSKTAETQALVSEYYSLVATAKASTTDTADRYSAFAEAEAYLIDHAFIIPIHISASDYVATRLNAFEAQYAPYGVVRQRFKGMTIRETAIGIEEYTSLLAQWESERESALSATN